MFKSQSSKAHTITAIAVSFLLPLTILFGWFFFDGPISFNFVSIAWLFLVVLAGVAMFMFKSSRLVQYRAAWLLAGCGVTFFCALFLAALD
ncbi:MAG TPA: hypothetical protein VF627_04385 [Abditibacterium sp.]|jgi:hypothetical protein